jgi:hypothetical protein
VVVNKLVQNEDQTQHLARLLKGQEACIKRLETGACVNANVLCVVDLHQ